MPSTPAGLPYPAATDPVAQGAAAIQALAEALDRLVPAPSATPPASPVDGQIWVYPAGGAGELWTFRYRAASASAYKWEFLGGPEVMIGIDTGLPIGSMNNDGGWLSDPNLGLIASRGGDYIAEAVISIACSAAANIEIGIGVKLPSVSVPFPTYARGMTYLTTGADQLMMRAKMVGVAAGATVRPFVVGGAIVNVAQRSFSLLPVRVA